MKKMMISVALMSALTAQASAIQFYTGNDLFQRLKSQETLHRWAGIGFVLGVHDTLDTITSCAPEHITVRQVVDIVEQFLDQNPSSRHFSATSLVRNALARAWPCKNKS